MDVAIKALADNGDLKSLKYIFVDSLDVDPTFVCYETEYEYCKSVPNLLEAHQELTPFLEDTTLWTEAYWTSLKQDLIKNFSDKRMMHMRQVATVFLAEKIQRILAERAMTVPGAKTEPKAEKNKESVASAPRKPVIVKTPTAPLVVEKQMSREEKQAIELEQERARLAKENAEHEARMKANRAKIQQHRVDMKVEQKYRTTGETPKKDKGVAVLVAAAIVGAIIVAVMLLK